MNRSVLVTGAAGFVGRHLVAALRQGGVTVIPASLREGGLEVHVQPFSTSPHVFHLSARTFVPDSWRDPLGFYEVNVLGTAKVLEFCLRTGASLTLLSSYVYGQPLRLPIGEDHPVEASGVITIADERPKRDFLFIGDPVRLPMSRMCRNQTFRWRERLSIGRPSSTWKQACG